MRQLKAFVKKEFLHVFRDTRTMLILFGMPVAQIILFGFAISTEVRNIDLAVVVPQSSEVTRRLTEKFDASEYFTVRKILRSTDGIERYFRDGSISMAIAFTPGFADEVLSPEGAGIQLITDGSNTNTARTAAGYATAVIMDALSEETAAEAAGIQTDVRMLFNPQMRSSYNFVPGVMGLIIILICAMMTSIAIVREKETGSMEVLLVSPIKPINIVLAKMIPYFVISCAVLVNILLLTIFVLKVPVAGSFFWMILVSVIYIILSLGIGMLVSSLVKTQIIATLICGMIFLVPVMMFSGMLYPIESMPVALQWFAQTIPAKWFIEAIRKIMIEGVPFVFVLTETGVLLAMTAVIFTAAVMKFNDRIE